MSTEGVWVRGDRQLTHQDGRMTCELVVLAMPWPSDKVEALEGTGFALVGSGLLNKAAAKDRNLACACVP